MIIQLNFFIFLGTLLLLSGCKTYEVHNRSNQVESFYLKNHQLRKSKDIYLMDDGNSLKFYFPIVIPKNYKPNVDKLWYQFHFQNREQRKFYTIHLRLNRELEFHPYVFDSSLDPIEISQRLYVKNNQSLVYEINDPEFYKFFISGENEKPFFSLNYNYSTIRLGKFQKLHIYEDF